MIQEETRKGPWTEQEDFQLTCFVGQFGDRRWNFIAEVSALNRTGKSCRLRWVNYLHPGLKKGKMTPQEEKLVIELQGKWGNRWSRIARKLPGRTDNEIKNYWRTHMRQQAQERKRSLYPSASSSKGGSSPSSTITTDSASPPENGKESFYDTGGNPEKTVMEKANEDKVRNSETTVMGKENEEEGQTGKGYSLDDLWDEIALSECSLISPIYGGWTEDSHTFSCTLAGSPALQYSDSLWEITEEESKILLPLRDQLYPCGAPEGAYNTDYL
ncbi:hypothetical protein MLD38_011604 [Melastoma candidum]|uniref:Uncharacterized protein n=1 Tax=Melastoma candidum TaxID=119954 RepID=A0ACB9R370_9MYRT|nr:hypothetical protein MLD38_011604 [Melastoma candidum]